MQQKFAHSPPRANLIVNCARYDLANKQQWVVPRLNPACLSVIVELCNEMKSTCHTITFQRLDCQMPKTGSTD
jgi:hypothetical protein